MRKTERRRFLAKEAFIPPIAGSFGAEVNKANWLSDFRVPEAGVRPLGASKPSTQLQRGAIYASAACQDHDVTNPTEIRNRLQQADPEIAAELLPLVYDELRKLAIARMALEEPGQTLQPTALVHEAYLRLVGSGQSTWDDRAHFFSAAAEAMRRILIENARRKGRLKHGGGLQRVDLDQLDVASGSSDEQILGVHEALEKLAVVDSQVADLIKLRFFAGLSNAQAAEVMKIPERTAKRRWAYARAWLYQELSRHE